MNRMLDKLRSGRGASITFGLLLFLVCAVLSSVIIATASTAAGRISNMAEADQRYYSVTSACELLKGLIDGKTVTIVENPDYTYLIPDIGGDEASIIDPSHDYLISDGVDSSVVRKSIVNKAAYIRYSGNSHHGTISGESVTISGLPEEVTSGTTVTTPSPAAPTSINETLDSDGDLKFTVTKQSGRNPNPFAMEMVFSVDENNGTYSKIVNTEEPSIQIKTFTYTWRLKSVRIISATNA